MGLVFIGLYIIVLYGSYKLDESYLINDNDIYDPTEDIYN
jgi:hypothetical protein